MDESTPQQEELKINVEETSPPFIPQVEAGTFQKNSISTEQKPLEHLQLFTTAGYLALLAIGITKEVLKYNLLDINILPYYNITDIALSPLDMLRQYWVIILTPVLLLFVVDAIHGTAKQMKERGKKKQWIDWWAKIEMNWGFLGVFYASFVLGIAFQSARSEADDLQEKLSTGTLEMTHQLTFQDQEQLKVAIVGQSSDFIFYVEEGQQQISISPMTGIVKSWVPLPQEKTVLPTQ